jgi:arylsulfatase
MKKNALQESIERFVAAKNRWPKLGVVSGLSFLLATTSICAAAPAPERTKPNIVFILMDNLGYGEIGAYGGGITRGAATPHIDSLAEDGMRFLNMNMETQCTPSRSSLMTGRWSIRSGTYQVPYGGIVDGLTQWEITIGESLSGAGYATAYYGKWHLGSLDGRLPNDQGFDEWYGIPRTSDETLWPTAVGYSKEIAPLEEILEGRKGEKSRKIKDYDLTERRLIDAELTRRSVDFITRKAAADTPFFAFIALTQPHLPTLPNPNFAGKTGNGDWADMLAETDHNVGQILAAIDKAGVKNDTIVIFTSDNGPEFTRPWDGWSGPWRGQYFTALEGGIRVPFLIRWPGKIAPRRVSNEIVHGVDMFATLARFAGAKVPDDRPIDSIDQSAFILGQTEKSAREGFPIMVADRLTAVKWRNWKMHFYRQDTMIDPPVRNPVPMVYNLFIDPREKKAGNYLENAWVMYPVSKIMHDFQTSLKQHPPIPMGTPDPYLPTRTNN